jgi:superfamily II DNA/RNA helicase
VVFTRTKRRAKVLTRQLVAAGVPAVELHGNLAQNARNRNLAAFSEGSSGTLVATDIAARGIHVDDVALVIHADPPVEHKAYLHRSGRTARAGAEGTVITLMTDDQQAEVRDLTRRAGVRPTTSRIRPGDPLLARLAPGERTFVSPPAAAPAATGGSGRSRGRGAASAVQTTPAARRGAAEPASAGRRAAGKPAGARRAGGHATETATAAARRRGSGHAAEPARPGAARHEQPGAARGQGRARRGAGQARTGSTPVHTSQSGSAAAFSANSRAGRRSGR